MNKFKTLGSKFYSNTKDLTKKSLYSTSFNADIVPLVHLHLFKNNKIKKIKDDNEGSRDKTS